MSIKAFLVLKYFFIYKLNKKDILFAHMPKQIPFLTIFSESIFWKNLEH